MKKKLLFIFILLMLVPNFVLAENVKNKMDKIEKESIYEVKEKTIVKLHAFPYDDSSLGSNTPYQAFVITDDYYIFARANNDGGAAIIFRDKTTYSVKHAESYGITGANGMAYDVDENKVYVSSGTSSVVEINCEDFSKGEVHSVTGSSLAYNYDAREFVTVDSNGKGHIYDKEFKEKSTFDASIYPRYNDISYGDDNLFLATHNETGKSLYDKVGKEKNLIYVYTRYGKYIESYYMNKLPEQTSTELQSIYIKDDIAYLLFQDGVVYSAPTVLNGNLQATTRFFDGAKFINVIRNSFSSLDYYIYTTIAWAIQGIFDLALLRPDVAQVREVIQKLYVFLGIFMFFKLTATFINYLLNPQDLLDRSKGVRKLLRNTVVALVLLIMLPSIFDIIYRGQKVFLPMVPKIILNQTQDKADKDVTKYSEDVAVIIIQPFFHPNYSTPDKEYASIDGTKEITSLKEFSQHVNDVSPLGKDTKNFAYSYSYSYVLTSIVGMISLALVVGITVTIAVRIFKLLFLEMIAPIPLMENISPYDNGSGPLTVWLKEVILSFLDLFFKVGLMYLVVYFAEAIKTNDMFITWENAEGTGITPLRLLYLKSFLIVGLLYAVYKLPVVLRRSFGIKDKDATIVSSFLSGITGFGNGIALGLASGSGFRGSLAQGIQEMNANYRNSINKSLKSAWSDVELETSQNSKQERKGVLDKLDENVINHNLEVNANKRKPIDRDSVNKARNKWQENQKNAKIAEANYNSIVANGRQDNETEEEYNDRRTAAYEEWQKKQNITKISENDYSLSKEVLENSDSSYQAAVNEKTKSDLAVADSKGRSSITYYRESSSSSESSQSSENSQSSLEENNTLEIN